MARITSKGQVTIPKEIRDSFGLEPGIEVEFVVEGTTVILCKTGADDALARWRGVLELDGSVDDFIEETRGIE